MAAVQASGTTLDGGLRRRFGAAGLLLASAAMAALLIGGPWALAVVFLPCALFVLVVFRDELRPGRAVRPAAIRREYRVVSVLEVRPDDDGGAEVVFAHCGYRDLTLDQDGHEVGAVETDPGPGLMTYSFELGPDELRGAQAAQAAHESGAMSVYASCVLRDGAPDGPLELDSMQVDLPSWSVYAA